MRRQFKSVLTLCAHNVSLLAYYLSPNGVPLGLAALPLYPLVTWRSGLDNSSNSFAETGLQEGGRRAC
jgi:hypothetical protein